ncbi:MAG TPA: class I SAM-dependent methyltransferase [Smithellaceae bacterium]|nr:class I SAM-dependent methyltransferase [Smithellaceae bacterium]
MENKIIENHQRFLERVALHRKFGYDIDKERSFIIEKARPVAGNILEAGTGKGYFALALAREGFDFTSFDISDTEQQYARLNLMYYGWEKRIRFDLADAAALPYADGSFDAVFSVNMIHHLSSVTRVINEFIRILSPSGKLILSDFNAHGMAIMDKVHASDGRKHETGEGTLADARAIIIKAGFKLSEYQSESQDVIVACRIK